MSLSNICHFFLLIWILRHLWDIILIFLYCPNILWFVPIAFRHFWHFIHFLKIFRLFIKIVWHWCLHFSFFEIWGLFNFFLTILLRIVRFLLFFLIVFIIVRYMRYFIYLEFFVFIFVDTVGICFEHFGNILWVFLIFMPFFFYYEVSHICETFYYFF